RDPQPGNNPKGNYDAAGSPENDTLQKPLQTADGSTPTGHPPLHGTTGGGGGGGGGSAARTPEKGINAAHPLHPTAAEDANDPSNPRRLLTGTSVVWTYLLTNPGTQPLTIASLQDDAGTPSVAGDDSIPQYVSGDANHNNKLDPGETWLYTSSGVVTYKVKAGLYLNTATVTATASGNQTVTASDPNYHFGTNTLLAVQVAVNAVDP